MPEHPINPYYRVIDANFNRAKEALRVIEEFSRFALNDKQGAAKFKRLRHQLTHILLGYKVTYVKLLASRDSRNDVGKKNPIRDVKSPKVSEILIANFKRAQESLRVLEELSKIIEAKAAVKFEKMRFEIYELERKTICRF